MKCTLCRVSLGEYAHYTSVLHTWEGNHYPVCLVCYASPRYRQMIESWEARMEYVRRSYVVDGKSYALKDWERELLESCPVSVSEVIESWQKDQDSNPLY